MRWLLRILLAIGVLMQAYGFSTAWAANAWQPAGLAGTLVRGLAIHPTTPTTLYASRGAGGVAKSTDGGASWSEASNGLGGAFVWPLAINPATPATVYVGSPGGGVFKSTNGGASWAAASSGLTNNIVWSLVIDPFTPTTLYAGTDGNGGGVFKSTDGGTNWVQLNLGLPNGSYVNVPFLLMDPASPGTLYGVVNDRVRKSTNGGSDWLEFNSGLTGGALSLALDPVTPGTLYAGTWDGRVFKSTNGGANWSAAGSAMASSGVHALAVAPTTPVTLYAATYIYGVFKSTDGGATWSAASSGLTSNQTLALAMDPTAPATLYVGTSDAGAFKSTNGALSSEARLRGLVLEAGGGPIALSPAFSRDTLDYSAIVTSGTASAALIPTSWSRDATMLVNGAAVASGSASAPLALNAGANTLTVVVVSGDGTSSRTYTVAVTRQAPPAAPTGVFAAASDGQATVSWNAPADNGSAITNYTVTAVEDGSKQCAPSPATATFCTVVGLTNGSSYTFRVTATNGIGTGAASTASVAVTPAGVPGPPTGVSAAAGNGQATVSWGAPSGNGSAITSYTVTAEEDGSKQCTPSPATATSCTVGGLVNGTAYTFRVAAINGVGVGAVSAPSMAVTPAGVPDAPAGVAATAGNAQATVVWAVPSANGSAITSFTVTAAEDATKQCTPSPATATSCTMVGLANGSTYTFTVRASNSVGSSAASAPSSPVTPSGKSFSGPLLGSGGTITASFTGGGPACAFLSAQVVAATAPSVAAPAGLAFAQGLFDFTLGGCDQTQVVMSITYPTLPTGAAYWKFSARTQQWAAFSGAQIGGSTVTLTLVDGGAGDDDGQVNGQIVDPGGPALMALAPGVSAIPTLSQFALMVLAGLMALLGVALSGLRGQRASLSRVN